MKLNRKRLRLALAIAASLIFGLSVYAIWPRDFLVTQTAKSTFYVDLPFEDVRKILVRSNATTDILVLGETGELKEYEWLERGIGLQNLNIFDPEWHVHAEARLKVQTINEEYVGSHLITLRQDVIIENDYLESVIALERGSDRLRAYENIARFTPDGDRTKVDTSLTLGILVTAPGFAWNYAQARVHDNATRKLEKQSAATIQVIEENKDQPLMWLP